jgi:hypothetical protein
VATQRSNANNYMLELNSIGMITAMCTSFAWMKGEKMN